MQPKINVWLEKDGNVALSLWRVQLLEAIAATGSISAAAKRLDVPYRRAWEKVQEIERGLGFAVLETTVGGAGGGGTRLTPAGRRVIVQFYSLVAGLEQELLERYQRIFGPEDQPHQPE